MKLACCLRPATLADANALSQLTGELGYSASEEDIVQRLRQLASSAAHAVQVAEWQGQVVGWIQVSSMIRLESPSFAEIVGLVVTQSARGQGVGRQLVAWAADWTRQQGLGALRVRSNVVRADAHRFYGALGFTSHKQQTVFTLGMAG